MPPDLDIYGLTKYRDTTTIDRFLEAYVDRAKSWDRGDEELMMEPLPLPHPETGAENAQWEPDTFEWEPALTLSHIIDRGLASPRRAFTAYLTPKRGDLTKVILSFTADDQLILGLSIDDEGAKPENERKAKELLAQLVEEYACHLGLILVEQYPPRSEMAFYARAKNPLAIFFSAFPEKPVP
jgi:hypothetical protein